MNERIAKLADQCRTEYHDGHGGFTEQFDEEKFAELIVRECINEIHVADIGDLKGKGYYLDKVAEHIEKHFGVEE
jgi:hypothetical protein